MSPCTSWIDLLLSTGLVNTRADPVDLFLDGVSNLFQWLKFGIEHFCLHALSELSQGLELTDLIIDRVFHTFPQAKIVLFWKPQAFLEVFNHTATLDCADSWVQVLILVLLVVVAKCGCIFLLLNRSERLLKTEYVRRV